MGCSYDGGLGWLVLGGDLGRDAGWLGSAMADGYETPEFQGVWRLANARNSSSTILVHHMHCKIAHTQKSSANISMYQVDATL
jgi:hypothetical protein